jgi:hypothetical protein
MSEKMSAMRQDLFISHSSKDKPRYVVPLTEAFVKKGITFWLDSDKIQPGDSFPLRINEGLRQTRFVLICLSSNFLKSSWGEDEMAAALAAKKHILPLILNSKALVLRKYPLLAARIYTLYRNPPKLVADEVARVVRPQQQAKDELHIVVESVHTEKLGNLHISPRVSIKWLSDQAQKRMGVTAKAKTGAYQPFMVKWVLVDVKAERAWKELPRSRQRRLSAVLHTPGGTRYCDDGDARLGDLKVADGTVFHMYAIEDEDYSPIAMFSQPPGQYI